MLLQDEYVGRMRPDAVPGGIKLLVATVDLDDARKIVPGFHRGHDEINRPRVEQWTSQDILK